MIRALFFVVKLALLVMAAVWLALRPGQVVINWQGYEVAMPLAVLLVGVAGLVVLAVAFHALWRALVSIPRSFSLAHMSRRQRKGYIALTQGLAAVAAGDGSAARRLAHKAGKFLNEPSLTLLLQAQAAQLNGDEMAASRYFGEMMARPDMSVLGLRGMVTQALSRGDTTQALALARRAHMLQPKAEWVLTSLVDLEARAGNAEAALVALSSAAKQGAIDPNRSRILRSTLLLESASKAGAGEVLRLAKKAYDTAPGWSPAAIHYARLVLASGHVRLAAKIIERTWRTAPHPELAKLYAEAGGDIPSTTQVKRFERLASFNPDAAESRLALARIALSAQLWGIARAQLDAVLAKGPNARACRLMAELEEREFSNMRTAREWQERAAAAPPEAGWQCEACHAPVSSWTGTCPSCGALGRVGWHMPFTPKQPEILAISHKN